jgi:hypothetical protein
VHAPEISLISGRFSSLGRVFGVWVDVSQRKISKGEQQIFAQSPLDFFDHRVGLSTKRTLIVAVFQELDRRTSRTLNMVTLSIGKR